MLKRMQLIKLRGEVLPDVAGPAWVLPIFWPERSEID